MKLKLKKHYYEGVSDYEIEIPDDTVFIYVDGDVGKLLHNGFNHYLAATKSEVKNINYNIANRYINFPGITFMTFDNVIFESDITIISSEEFYNKFNIGSYYIIKYLSSYNTGKYKLLSISKILEIHSHYRIKIFTAHVASWLNAKEFHGVTIDDSVSLSGLTDDHFCVCNIVQNAEQEFINAINETLSFVNYKAVSDQPSD